ncbi:hypothetical protein, conserved [Angomonas deanei]|uniref:B30.2/SPRY domain-containing protein n=1 Tax=Angomonas deanei TaxID=59799 RepID=A0A7G2CR18_9TRYP|nr:hypothetical protein, conserved [Angomonas deanei]
MIEDALYTVERHSSSPSLYLPSPLVAVTTDDEDCFVVRCAPVTATKFWFAVSINSEVSGDQLLYVGVTASTSALPKRCEEVALWEDSWPLCSVDSTSTNSVNCILEPLMIFNGDSSIFLPGDVLLVGVNRLEGTVEFSRVRQGGRIDFGVLFDSVPDDVTLRPFVVCGPQTVAVFSLKDGLTFPSRDIYPSSHFNSVVKDATSCSVCDQLLTAPWFATEDKTTLCTNCFTSWRKPKELFYVGRAPTNACEVPKYIVCRNAPHSLKVGGYVEFDENFTLTWSPDRSVNCEVVGTAIVAEAEESFGVTEPLPLYGVSRADVVLDHIAGVPGFPFSGLCPFKPLWKEGSTKSQCSLTCDTLNVSCTTFPRNTKAMVVLDISPALGSPPILFSQVFLGVSTLTDNSYHIFQADMDKLCANNSLWGTWCDSKEKVSPEGRVYLVVDNIAGNLYMSSTIADLSENPVVVACGWPTDDNFYLRLCVYSQAEGGSVTSTEGCFSSSTPSETSLTTVAIGLFPEKGTDLADPSFVESEVVLFDTVQGTELISQAQWKFNNEALSGEVDAAFRIGDTLTFVRRNATLTLYCQGHLLATTVVSPDVRYRVIVYLSCPGLTAKVCAPVMGRAHLGKVVRVYGGEIGTVEYNSNDWEKRYFTVRRKDVRFCALAASQYAAKDLRENATVVFKSSGFQAPKRGTLVSIASNGMSLNVTALDDPRTVLSLKLDQCFVLDNEGPDASNSTLYPLISPPMSTVTTLFEVGKSRSNSQNKGSYNGIIFDCKASNSIDLVGLSCLSRTTGRHHVDIFYKKGSHYKFESEPKAWSNVYSGMVEMQVDAQFQISFAPIHIEPSSTFSLYVNSSHNCSVGFFGEEDGGRGEIGQEFDSDGTITVFLGKKSTSSVPFGDFSLSTRGFCGTLMYRQNKGSRLPLLECPANTEAVDRLNAAPLLGDVQRLVSRPMCHAVAPRISFHLTVTGPPISVDEIRLPILLEKTRRDAPSIGASHCVVSVFMSRVCELGDSESYTRWCWNTKVPLTDHVTIATLSGKPVYLEKGIYVFLLVADTHDREDINCYFIDAKGSNYRKENSLFAVENFFGDVYGQLDISCFSGDKYTLTTGAYLNQRSSASYNGIMFDLRSKENITLEEIFCLSQTTAECVSVTVFWKEGSMKDMERQPSQWKEVASKDMALFDKLPFSVGGLYLPMKANTTYAIYVNTSSSCGVRFFNNNDGDLGSFGDELESDGVLTVYVGRKSESSRPFAEIPLEARAFRGKIVYRKLTQGALDGTSCALFPYMKAFIITRILVALIAFVESQSGDADESQFPYTELFSTISVLLPSSGEMLVGLELAEDTLQNVLRTTPLEELQASIVSVSLFPHDTAQTLPVCKGDTVLVYRPETVSYDTVTAMEDGFASGMCRIECGGQETPRSREALSPGSLLSRV